jgi:hypothetical protein
MPPYEWPDCNNGTSGSLVKTGLDDFTGKMAQRFVVRRPCEGHDPAVVGGNRRLIEADVAK